MPNTFDNRGDSQLANNNRTSSDIVNCNAIDTDTIVSNTIDGNTIDGNTIDGNKAEHKTILLLGHSGFIGQQVLRVLQTTPHTLLTPSRQQADFSHPNQAQLAKQLARLVEGVDVVINMIGVMRQDARLLEQIHHHAPVAMARLAKQQGVKHWINLSALGADAQHTVAFVASKGRGDKALLALADASFSVSIARPSLVFGRGGASCELFLKLATLPVLALPNAGKQLIQPVHVNDVAQGLVNLALQSRTLSDSAALTHIFDFTGAQQCTLADYFTMMRVTIHHRQSPVIIPIPNLIAETGISLLHPCLPKHWQSMLSQDSLRLLNAGSVTDHAAFSQLLDRAPLGYREFS